MRHTLLCIAAGTMVAAAGADELLVTTEIGIVQTIDLATGTAGFRGVCTGSVSSLAVADGVIYLGSADGNVYVYDLDSNQIVDSFLVDSDNNAMAWLGDELVIGGSSGELLFVDPADGSVNHSIPQVGTDITAIGVDAGGMFVGGHTSLALRSHLGQDSFQFFAACGSMINGMAFGNTTMYLVGSHFGGNGGTVYKFDKFVGGVSYTGTYDVDNNASTVLWHNGLLYVGGDDGSVLELDPATGDVKRSFNFVLPITGIAPADGLVSCAADYDASGTLNFFDVQKFVELYLGHLPAGDTTGDGLFNFFDIQHYIDLYNTGC